VGNVKKSYRGNTAPGADQPVSPGLTSSQCTGGILEKHPWAKAIKARLDAASSTSGPQTPTNDSGSEGVHAGEDSSSSGIPTSRDNQKFGGAGAGGSVSSGPTLAPGQPFYELLRLIQDPATTYSHGLAVLTAHLGNVEILRAFKSRGWLKEVAGEQSWLSSALLARHAEMGLLRKRGG